MRTRKKKDKSLPILESWDGSPEGKARFHKDAQAILRSIASEAGLGAKDFEVHSNTMGPALAGTAYLFADSFHLWIDGGSRGDWSPPAWRGGKAAASREGYVIARRVAHRKDHVGCGENVALDWELLWDPPSLVKVLKLEGVIA